jgi:hypothetical protein
MMKLIKISFVCLICLISLPFLLHADTNFQVGTGDWNTPANWSAGVPGVSDFNARMNNGGTLNVTAPPTVTSGIDFRINTSAGANTVNWNPGSGTMTFNAYYIGGGGSGSANVTHDSGQINLSTVGAEQFRVGNDSAGTYTMNGSAVVQYNEAMSVGHLNTGNGHLIMNGESQVIDTANDNGGTFFGYNEVGAQGRVTMNDSSFFFSRGQTHLGFVDGASGALELNDTAQFDSRNEMLIGNNGTGTLTMGGDSLLRFGVGANDKDFRAGAGATGSGTVTLSGNARVEGQGSVLDDVSIGFLGAGVLVMNDDSSFGSLRNFGLGDQGTASSGEVTLNGTSRIDAFLFFQVGRVGAGTITINDSAAITAGSSGPIRLAANLNSTAVLTLNGANASVSAAQNIDIASANAVASTALFDQNNGEVFVAGAISIGNGVAGNAATYNLDGGTLRANNITVSSTGVFNWGAGTMTVRQVSENASGDGSIINFDGSLTSSSGSTLDLNSLYESGSIRFDKLAVNGALDLSAGGDVFEFWDTMQRLRGTGGIITGELQLISAASILGEFDTILGPGPDAGTFFRTWGPGEIAQGTSADALQLNYGYLDYRAGDGVYFVYKVNGQVPEPQTGMLVIFAVLFLRGLSKRSWLVMLRQKLNG